MQQRFVFILALLVANALALGSICNSFTSDMTTDEFTTTTTLNFGIGDNPSNASETQYSVPLFWGWYTYNSLVDSWNTNFYLQLDEIKDSLLEEVGAFYVNHVPLMGGRNWTSYTTEYVRTANFVCAANNQSFMWGPAYADFRRDSINSPRFVDPNLESYVHVSAPKASSYIRYITFITNKSNQKQKLELHTANYLNYAFNDISPFNNGRYIAGYPWFDTDPGLNTTFRSEWSGVALSSTHARGPSARDTRYSTSIDMDCWDAGFTYNGEIQAGETRAVMIVYSFAMNKAAMLQRAAWVDGEPSELFHDLTADQLSQIVNWGACQSVLGPDVTVTVTPPSSCSSGLTSDFTVSATTTRNDLGAGFKHRVVLTQGTNEFEVVAAQSSTTLSVLNNIGQVKHQLWFKNCIVKETTFTACSNKPSSKRAVVANVVEEQVSSKKSSSSLMNASTSLIALTALLLRTSTTMRLCVFVLVLLVANATSQNVCNSFTKDIQTSEISNVAEFYFGTNDSPDGRPMYFVPARFAYGICCNNPNGDWNTNLYLEVKNDMNTLLQNVGSMMINGGYIMGGKNWTLYSTEYVRTADLECSNANQTFMWGPAYADMRQDDLNIRSSNQNLETYIQVSVPNTTNYMRYILFVTNKSNKQEKLHIQTVNYAYDAPLDVSPLNDARYIANFPLADGDDGSNAGDAANYNKVLTSTHVRGPKARDTTVHSYNDMDCWDVGLTYNGAIEAGETKAFMIVYSFAPNKTRMLQSAAWVDTEPAELFHGLNADQLSHIVNWGACQKMLSGDVTVTVTPPSQCSSDMTSDFTVNVTTTRKDFTSSFSHRVVGGVIPVEIVPVQSSNTLTVINDAGSVVHQLWYNGCLIKETPFTACETVVVPQSVPVGSTTPTTGKTSSATTLTVSAAIIGVIAALL